MARPIPVEEARRLKERHIDIIDVLCTARPSLVEHETKIKHFSDAIVAQEVMKVLADIPVEEINRDKKGFRTKALREHGYNTIADLASASVYSIASVRGVSEDSAYSIKGIVNEIVAKSTKGQKIRLSTDNKTLEASKLVTAISQYRRLLPVAKDCDRLLSENHRNINLALEDLTPATTTIGWFFTSKAKKQKAEYAYNYLRGLVESAYGREADVNISLLGAIERGPNRDVWEDFSANSIQFFNYIEDINPGILGNDDAVYGLPEDLAREVQDEAFFPDGLLCDLRKYQEWGVKYILHQGKVLLGDEMGLGKTVQAIATMVSLKNTGATHFVVVCPASVITNWCREIRKMSKLSVTKVHGVGREAALSSWIRTGGVAVTTFEGTLYFNLPEHFSFDQLVVDEAHYIKNPGARRTKNVKELINHTERLLFMTGTALENKVDEMIALIGMLQPRIASRVRNMAFLSAAPQFREEVAPVYYRRKREDVLTELPDLIETEEWCTLDPYEEEVYENDVLSKSFVASRRVSWSVDDIGQSSKAKRLQEIVMEAESEGRKVIVFSFFLDTIRKVSMLLGNRCTNPINGSVPPQRRQEIIDEFEKAPAGSVLVAQIQSGGTGLNIQSASVVILCEPQLKPSIENQAISRAYRMGQTRNVLVYRLLCENTIDERILEILEQKRAEFDAFADKSVAAAESIEVDNRKFGEIIQEEINRINAKRAQEHHEYS